MAAASSLGAVPLSPDALAESFGLYLSACIPHPTGSGGVYFNMD
jgi:hypothetical protein